MRIRRAVARSKYARERRCAFEVLESRSLLAADLFAEASIALPANPISPSPAALQATLPANSAGDSDLRMEIVNISSESSENRLGDQLVLRIYLTKDLLHGSREQVLPLNILYNPQVLSYEFPDVSMHQLVSVSNGETASTLTFLVSESSDSPAPLGSGVMLMEVPFRVIGEGPAGIDVQPNSVMNRLTDFGSGWSAYGYLTFEAVKSAHRSQPVGPLPGAGLGQDVVSVGIPPKLAIPPLSSVSDTISITASPIAPLPRRIEIISHDPPFAGKSGESVATSLLAKVTLDSSEIGSPSKSSIRQDAARIFYRPLEVTGDAPTNAAGTVTSLTATLLETISRRDRSTSEKLSERERGEKIEWSTFDGENWQVEKEAGIAAILNDTAEQPAGFMVLTADDYDAVFQEWERRATLQERKSKDPAR